MHVYYHIIIILLIKLVPLDQSDYGVPLDQRPHRPTKSDN